MFIQLGFLGSTFAHIECKLDDQPETRVYFKERIEEWIPAGEEEYTLFFTCFLISVFISEVVAYLLRKTYI